MDPAGDCKEMEETKEKVDRSCYGGPKANEIPRLEEQSDK